MPPKAKVPAALWIAFALVDLVIVAAVLVAFFWVAPVPGAFGDNTTLASARADQPGRPVVAVVTADSCLSCQMYKRGALTDARFAAWIEQHASGAYLKWGTSDTDIASIGVTRYPATVLVAGDAILATHYGSMRIEELLAFLGEGLATAPQAEEAGPQAPGPDAGG